MTNPYVSPAHVHAVPAHSHDFRLIGSLGAGEAVLYASASVGKATSGDVDLANSVREKAAFNTGAPI